MTKRLRKFELLVHWDGILPKDCPLSQKEITKIIKIFQKLSIQVEEWQQLVIELGAEPSSLGILFCDDKKMREFQKKYRQLDRTTDVLSFPAIENLSPGMGELGLGDLVVSLPAVQRGAKRGKRTFKLELTEVLIHGCLHLLGCDHVLGKNVSREKALRMKFLQKNLFRDIRKTIK